MGAQVCVLYWELCICSTLHNVGNRSLGITLQEIHGNGSCLRDVRMR